MLGRRITLRGGLFAAVVAAITPANAAVVNPSFEQPALADGGFQTGNFTGWVATSGSAGVFNPTTAEITPTDGAQVAFVGASSLVSQVLSDTLAANTTYTLSVDVGERLDATFGGYNINLYAGSTLLASDLSTLTPVIGGWVTSTVTYTSPGSGPLIGQQLKIELADGPASGAQTEFDNVRLSTSGPSTAAPEASSLAIWSVLGLAVGAGTKWRRRKAA